MNELIADCEVPESLREEVEEIRAITDLAELARRFWRAHEIGVEAVIAMAAIVRQVDDLGKSIPDVPVGLLSHLRRIAHGQELPGLMARLQGRPRLLRLASSLPKPDQQKIVDNEPLKLLEPGGDHHMVAVDNLTDKETRQAIGNGHFRDDSEQAAYLRDKEQRKPKVKVKDDGIWVVDRTRGGISKGDEFIPLEYLADAVSELTRRRNGKRTR